MENFLKARDAWESARPLRWDTRLERELQERLAGLERDEIVRDCQELGIAVPVLLQSPSASLGAVGMKVGGGSGGAAATAAAAADEESNLWVCLQCCCDNASDTILCVACRAKRVLPKTKLWTCYACSVKNKDTATQCAVCTSSKTRSAAIRAILDRKAAEAREAARQADEEAMALAREAAAAEAEELRLEREELERDGRFPHPGSLARCGGNPSGFCQTATTDGRCGPGCANCGRGTHWSCCGSSDRVSAHCLNGLTRCQATFNASMFCREISTQVRFLNFVFTVLQLI